MEHYFICLANSYKRGGRCIAGIEIAQNESGDWTIIRNQDGTPHWIRPVSYATYGEIFNYEAKKIGLFSVVRVTDMSPCPINAHSENVHYKKMECLGMMPLTTDFLNELTDKIHQTIFYNYDRTISLETYNKGNYSLMFIRPEKAYVYVDNRWERPKFRMRILYHGIHYDMPITDPAYLQYLEHNPQKTGELAKVILTLSLGLEYQYQHHKLIAAVVFEDQISSLQSGVKKVERDVILKCSKAPHSKPYPSPLENKDILGTEEPEMLKESTYSSYDNECEVKEHKQVMSIKERLKAFFRKIKS